MSADSGINTFRDAGGLWEGHDVMEVATPQGWAKDPEMVLEFYNQRRKNVRESDPNAGHLALVELETAYKVSIVTQNVDDLHERAGSSEVLHLHGEIIKSKSSMNDELVYDCHGDIKIGDLCELGAQLRPHVVWFGEMVPMMDEAIKICMKADILLVVGTSLLVYPAAGLVNYVPGEINKYVIDPKLPEMPHANVHGILKRASVGLPELVSELMMKTKENG